MQPKKACEKVVPEIPVSKKIGRHSLPLHIESVSKNQSKITSPEERLPKREIDFTQLDDGSLVEVVEHAVDPRRTRLAVFKSGRVRFFDRLEHDGEVLVPLSRDVVGFAEVKLPLGTLPYGSATQLMCTIVNFMQYAVDVPDAYRLVLAAFVLYTWLADRLPTAVYLSITGLPQSGKSTLLELLSLLCRRPLLASDISEAAMYQACSFFSPTLLIDEVDWKSSKITGTSLYLLRAGSGRSSRALRIRKTGCSFGPKVFCSLECSLDSALNS